MLFRKQTVEQIRQAMMDDAQRMHLEHSAAAEHHQALADMYAQRYERLGGDAVAVTLYDTSKDAVHSLISGAIRDIDAISRKANDGTK